MSLTCCFTGHRPNKLGGYDWNNPLNKTIMKIIKETVIDLIENRSVDTFIFGGALGIDQMSYVVVYNLKLRLYPNIKLILAMPFEKQSNNWLKRDKMILERQKQLADKVVLVDTLENYKINGLVEGEFHPAKYQKRNEFMVDNSDIVIAIWDGSKGGTYNCVKYAEKMEKEIIRINPNDYR